MTNGAGVVRHRRVRAVTLAGLVAAMLVLPALAGATPPSGQGSTGGTTPTLTTPNSNAPGKTKKASPTAVAATPPMGWDSWDSFGCGVNQRDVEQAANWLVASGLRDAGYKYVIIDDCWYDPTRSASGSLRANPSKFPNGMRWLGWYLHSHGLLFGIYASAQQSTCAQLNHLYPGTTGSLGHERQDAETFASWGVDYVKYDWCSDVGNAWDQIADFETMRDALRATGRPIVYSINPNSFHTATGAQSNWSAVANLVRTAPDLAPVWDMGPQQDWYSGVVNAITENSRLWGRAGPGHWNDPDSLVVGMQALSYASAVGSPPLSAMLAKPPAGVDTSLSFEEMRTNFAMWAMMAAPLIIGDDVPFLSAAARRLLLNPWMIEIDQDPLGRQGHPVRADGEVWLKRMSNRTVAVALFNAGSSATTITTNASQLGLPAASSYSVRDAWTGAQTTTKGQLQATVPAHAVAVFLLTPVVAAHSPHKG